MTTYLLDFAVYDARSGGSSVVFDAVEIVLELMLENCR